MSDVVIKAEGLGKKYTIGHQAENGSYLALRDVLMENARGLWNKTRDLARGRPLIVGDTHEEMWALRDVSFEIRRGETVGIIGRNGAGKSTLLKVLSRITEPSAGRVTIKGRVASLLEVGTGFHPELTGRENIYLNGAVLGMTRAEIKRKFDEIVAFAEVERFLDTPVKRYSSGMYVRLAFAVAAHLEPEILVVDEVLAVGDAKFQKKSLGKMGEIADGGRTVLFVSHNMGAITSLVRNCLLLHNGELVTIGPPEQVVRQYLDRNSSLAQSIAQRTDRFGTGEIRFIDCVITDTLNGSPREDFFSQDDVYLTMTLLVKQEMKFWVSVQLVEVDSGRAIMLADTALHGLELRAREGEEVTLTLHFPAIRLLEGMYSVTLNVFEGSSIERCDRVSDAVRFTILPTDLYGVGRTVGSAQGVVHLEHEWLDVANQTLSRSK
ncbi:MAG: ABC transporter ATP-binding protein [Candidatus Promineofilum sp.]|nr:ABC transporter ATP-binding protein [Promineifilum sp.]